MHHEPGRAGKSLIDPASTSTAPRHCCRCRCRKTAARSSSSPVRQPHRRRFPPHGRLADGGPPAGRPLSDPGAQRRTRLGQEHAGPAFGGRFTPTVRASWGLRSTRSRAVCALLSVHLAKLPRMADYAKWGEAVGRGLKWGAETLRLNLPGESQAGERCDAGRFAGGRHLAPGHRVRTEPGHAGQ